MSSLGFLGAIRGTFLAIVLAMSLICRAAEEPPGALSGNSGLYVKVRLDGPVKLSKLKPGDVVQGKLVREVYSADHVLFPAESSVRLTVERMEERHRAMNDHWPWVVKAFTPRHEKYPVFKTATMSGISGDATLQVSLLSMSRMRDVRAQSKGKRAGETGMIEVSNSGGAYGSKKLATPVMVLEASIIIDGSSTARAQGAAPAAGPDLSALEALQSGTALKILLLGNVSASKNKPGDMVQARLIEPVFVNSRLALPAGSMFEGKVVKQTPPRWGSRAGSLALTFSGITLPDGNFIPIAASLIGAELDRSSHTRMDAEGKLHGERPGKAWIAINIGVTAGLAKEVDDGTQLIVEALISTATDASTAGTARIVSSCISGIFMVTRHGRDVVLPRFTEMDIALDRPVSVSKSAELSPSAAVTHGN